MEQKMKLWSFFPEDPVKVRSIFEMLVFVGVFGFCYFLFIRWNTVPQKVMRVRIENLEEPREGYLSTRIPYSVSFSIPMTKQANYVKDIRNNVSICPLPWKQSSGSAKNLNAKEKKDIDSLRTVLTQANSESCQYQMDYISTEFALPYDIHLPTWLVGKPEIKLHIEDSLKKYLLPKDTIICSGLLTDHNTIYLEKYASGFYQNKGLQYNMSRDNNGIGLANTPVNTPGWLQLEDISQSYVEVDIKSATIDSITLTIDFVGSTEFSIMDPIPDKITMSSVEFSDSLKIAMIRHNGLRFHAKFRELENMQQIRVFFVTAIMSGFVTIFIVFIIYLPIRAHRIRTLSGRKNLFVRMLSKKKNNNSNEKQ